MHNRFVSRRSRSSSDRGSASCVACGETRVVVGSELVRAFAMRIKNTPCLLFSKNTPSPFDGGANRPTGMTRRTLGRWREQISSTAGLSSISAAHPWHYLLMLTGIISGSVLLTCCVTHSPTAPVCDPAVSHDTPPHLSVQDHAGCLTAVHKFLP